MLSARLQRVTARNAFNTHFGARSDAKSPNGCPWSGFRRPRLDRETPMQRGIARRMGTIRPSLISVNLPVSIRA